MQRQAIQYVALDVHQATLVVSVRKARGRWRCRRPWRPKWRIGNRSR